jgi:hypothetical protein
MIYSSPMRQPLPVSFGGSDIRLRSNSVYVPQDLQEALHSMWREVQGLEECGVVGCGGVCGLIECLNP